MLAGHPMANVGRIQDQHRDVQLRYRGLGRLALIRRSWPRANDSVKHGRWISALR